MEDILRYKIFYQNGNGPNDCREHELKNIADSWSPKGRFYKTNISCGRGSFKNAFLGYDFSDNIKNQKKEIFFDKYKKIIWIETKYKMSKENEERFMNEIKLTNEKHKNILNLISVFVMNKDTDKAVIVTIYPYYNTLRNYFKEPTPQSNAPSLIYERKIFKFIYEMISGLDFLHNELNVIHRDIKVDNIMIDDENNVKIIDFGLSTKSGVPKMKRQESITNQDEPKISDISKLSILGTPNYMAPEMYYEEKIYDNKVDIYAFGLTILSIFLNKEPFYKETELSNGVANIIYYQLFTYTEYQKSNVSSEDKLNINLDREYKKFGKDVNYTKKKLEEYPLLKSIIEDCIKPVQIRPNITELKSKYLGKIGAKLTI
tara:strand:- start:416 stop:1537 length:1122 start_codon:yes stop_codon:yes gene_type:complete